MSLSKTPKTGLFFAMSLLSFLAGACSTGGGPGIGSPPSVSGTHTVMGRAFFPGGTMVLVDAHLTDGRPSGTVEFSQVQSRGEIALRVFMDVACIGIFKGGNQAFVTGSVTRSDGDFEGRIGPRDWWFVQITEGGEEGDLLLSSRIDRDRGLRLCQEGPVSPETLRAVDGDFSIH